MKPRVLVVDDEAAVRHSLQRLLAFEPFEVVQAEDGFAALGLLSGAETAVIISDQHMPRMLGVDLLRIVRDQSPDTSRILFSGEIDVELLRNAVNAGEVYRFVTKPWSDEELILAIRNGIERWHLMRQNRVLQQHSEEQNWRLSRFNAELEGMVAARTMDLEDRNRALLLSQEVLDALPIAVIGIDPDGRVALINALARQAFPAVGIGGQADRDLPNAVWALICAAADRPITEQLISSPIGRLRCLANILPDRAQVITGIPMNQNAPPSPGRGMPSSS